jgi:catechol 2,3-dioxygenase-like lactoylglutathione lyase family enzyme
MKAPYVEHVNLSVRSIERTVAFLQTACPELAVRCRGGAPERRWLHLGTEASYLALEEPHPIHGPEREPYRTVGINHVGLVVPDVAAVRARLGAAGYREGMRVAPHPARLRAYFFDDDGVEYEFVQYLTDDLAARNAVE